MASSANQLLKSGDVAVMKDADGEELNRLMSRWCPLRGRSVKELVYDRASVRSRPDLLVSTHDIIHQQSAPKNTNSVVRHCVGDTYIPP
jgi:hypothetical protein